MVNNLPANVRDTRDAGSMSGSGRSTGVGNPSPVFLLGKFHRQRSLWATVYRVAKNQT